MHVLNACMNCNFNCAVVGVVVVYVYGLVVTHTHTHTHTHTCTHVATYEYKCLWHSNMYMQHLQHPQQSGTAGHTEIEAADSYTQTDKPVPSSYAVGAPFVKTISKGNPTR